MSVLVRLAAEQHEMMQEEQCLTGTGAQMNLTKTQLAMHRVYDLAMRSGYILLSITKERRKYPGEGGVMHALTISRVIDAAPSRVWAAWSRPEALARRWIPAPIECQVVKLDLRPGGAFETHMREGDDEFKPHIAGCFLEVIPEHRLVWTTALTEGWQPAEPWLALTCILTFLPEGQATRYDAWVLHKTAQDCEKHEALGFHPGWGKVLDQLEAYLGQAR